MNDIHPSLVNPISSGVSSAGWSDPAGSSTSGTTYTGWFRPTKYSESLGGRRYTSLFTKITLKSHISTRQLNIMPNQSIFYLFQ
uniref:Uncharacterized protein n=1 Tax=Pararge aegeria TaxID=116150 RepID=S4P0B8_9NEOP